MEMPVSSVSRVSRGSWPRVEADASLQPSGGHHNAASGALARSESQLEPVGKTCRCCRTDRPIAALHAMLRAPADVQPTIVEQAHPFQAAIEWHRERGMH